MKKILLFMSAATMLAAISCNKVEVNNPQKETPSVNQTHESIEFVAYTEVETKTTLNGYATEWEEGDEIDINEVVFTAQESGKKSVFTMDPEAEVPEAPYHAGYPSTYVYDNNENIEGNLAFNFPNEHILNEGEICEDVLAVAYSESEPSLYFKNVVSLLKFQAPEFTEDITEIRISTSEPLAGCVYVDYTNATWTLDESVESLNEVILTAKSGKFEAGKTYYVPVLPGAKTNLTVYINGRQAATVKEFECKRNVIHNIGTLPTPKKLDRNLAFSNTSVVGYTSGWVEIPTLNGVTEGVQYTSSSPEVASVDSATGKLTITEAKGTTTITASAPETDKYLAGSASYTLTVHQSNIRIYVRLWPKINNWDKWKNDPYIYFWGAHSSNSFPGNKLTYEKHNDQYDYYYEFEYSKTKKINFVVSCNQGEQSFDVNNVTLDKNYYFSVYTDWHDGGKLTINQDSTTEP